MRFEEQAVARLAEVAPAVDHDVMTAMFNLMRASTRVVQDLELGVHRPAGWSWAGFRIMFTVLVAGPLEERDLAKLAGVSRASISAVLNTLERDDLVARARRSGDRRLVTVDLTAAGRERLLDVYTRHHAAERGWLSGLSGDEVRQLSGLLRKILARGPAGSPYGAPGSASGTGTGLGP
ncbi:MAG: MarR family winged helix-turn-helix transcriptional regulator [bacterium]|nr:MarR family winged helix-turn-helix transcriptional regulator [bacterium]